MGKAFAFDDSVEHEARNDSDQLRGGPGFQRLEPLPDFG